MNDALRLFSLLVLCGGCGGPSCSHIQKFAGAYAWNPRTTPLHNASGDDKPVYLVADEDGRVRRVQLGDDGEPKSTLLFPEDVCGEEDVASGCQLASRPGRMTYALEQHALRAFDDDGQRAWLTDGADPSNAVLTIDRADGVAVAEASEGGNLRLRRVSSGGDGTTYEFSIFDSAGETARSLELSSMELVRPLFDGDLLIAASVRGADPQAVSAEHSFVTRVSPEGGVRWAKRFVNDVLFEGVGPRVLGAREFASGEILLAVRYRTGSALVLSANGEVVSQGESAVDFETSRLGFPMAGTEEHIFLPGVYRGALQVDAKLSSNLEFTTAAALQPTEGRGTVLGERPGIVAIQSEGGRVFFQVAGPNSTHGIVSLTQAEAVAATNTLDPGSATEALSMTDLQLRVTRSEQGETEAWTVPALRLDHAPLSPITADCSGDNSPC